MGEQIHPPTLRQGADAKKRSNFQPPTNADETVLGHLAKRWAGSVLPASYALGTGFR
jgi:hypothetical protein